MLSVNIPQEASMIKHKPIPKTNVSEIINGVKIEYKCNAQGILELPTRMDRFNPIEEVKIKKKPKDDK
jgi:hypothetical protein